MSDVPDATEVDPEGHRVVFENDHVRVLEVRLPAGKAVPMHAHAPRIIAAVNGYRVESTTPDGETAVHERRPGEVIWSEGEAHAAVALSDVHTVEVEVKSARR